MRLTPLCLSFFRRAAVAMLSLGTLATHGGEPATDVSASYVPYRFADSEGWRTQVTGNRGTTTLAGRVWRYDFAQGAQSVSLTLPARSLLSSPRRFRLRVRGEAKGHPVRVSLRTHFMTFHKVVGELPGSGEQELVFEAPPGEGWQWSGGENDGKIHGPLRLGEIRLEANGKADQGTLELLNLTVEGRCPTNRLCVVNADLHSEPSGNWFRVELASLADRPLAGTLSWVVRDWNGDALDGPRETRVIKLPARAEPLRFSFRAPRSPQDLRFAFAEATFELKVPGQIVAPAQAY